MYLQTFYGTKTRFDTLCLLTIFYSRVKERVEPNHFMCIIITNTFIDEITLKHITFS